jgi:hypothetical protein
MQLPQIRLQSQPAKIEIHTIQPKQSIQQPKPDVSIEQPKADMRIETKPAKLTIDQTQAWQELGRKSALVATDEAAQLGKEAVLEGTGRVAMEGDELMRIENGGNPIIEHAINNAYGPMKEFNIGWIPSHGSVKIHYEPADVQIDIQKNDPIISIKANKPIHEYIPGRVEIALKQYAELKIDFVNVNWKEIRL